MPASHTGRLALPVRFSSTRLLRGHTLPRMSFPRAYFLTWRTYGSWLHGDERGCVDRTHNILGTPMLDPDPKRHKGDLSRMANSAFKLNEGARRIVQETITCHCDLRGWEIAALNVRTEHVHVIVSCGEIKPEDVMSQLKAWCTRRLREVDLASPDASVWSHHGSTQHLWKESDIAVAVTYVMDCQGADLP